MNLKALECFFALARELHFGRAAESLYMGQSSLSESIKSLEHKLGGTLFVRSSRRVELTDFGRQALELLEPRYRELSGALDACRRIASGERDKLKIGFLGGGFYELHTPFVREFRETFPAVELLFTELTYRTHFRAVAEGQVDLALCRLPVGWPGLTRGPILLQDQRMLCVPNEHPLAAVGVVDPEQLATVKLCRIPAGVVTEEWENYHFPRQTPGGQPIASGPIIETVREGVSAVSAGEGCLMITRRAVQYFQTPNVTFVEIDLPPMPSALVRRANDQRPLLASTQALLYRIAQRLGTAPVLPRGTEFQAWERP